jgi:hypothetical protein
VPGSHELRFHDERCWEAVEAANSLHQAEDAAAIDAETWRGTRASTGVSTPRQGTPLRLGTPTSAAPPASPPGSPHRRHPRAHCRSPATTEDRQPVLLWAPTTHARCEQRRSRRPCIKVAALAEDRHLPRAVAAQTLTMGLLRNGYPKGVTPVLVGPACPRRTDARLRTCPSGPTYPAAPCWGALRRAPTVALNDLTAQRCCFYSHPSTLRTGLEDALLGVNLNAYSGSCPTLVRTLRY